MKIVLPSYLYKITKKGSVKLTKQALDTIQNNPQKITQVFNNQSKDIIYTIKPISEKNLDISNDLTFQYDKQLPFFNLVSGSLCFDIDGPLSIYGKTMWEYMDRNHSIKELTINAKSLKILYKTISNLLECEKINFNNAKFIDAHIIQNCPKLKEVNFHTSNKDMMFEINRQSNQNLVYDISDYSNIKMELPFFSYSLYFLLPHNDTTSTFEFSTREFNSRTCYVLLEDIFQSPKYKVNTSAKFYLKTWFTNLNKYEKEDMVKAIKNWDGKPLYKILGCEPNKIIALDFKKLWVACANKTDFPKKNRWTYVQQAVKEAVEEGIKHNIKMPNKDYVEHLFNKYKDGKIKTTQIIR